MNEFLNQELQAGSSLPVLVRALNQDRINAYAEAVSDFNPVHIDPAFAAKSGFGNTIAHGMLVLAYVSEMMSSVAGENWLSTGKLAVRFKSPALSTDTITIKGKVDSISENNGCRTYKCSVDCHNQKGDTIITGETEVTIPC